MPSSKPADALEQLPNVTERLVQVREVIRWMGAFVSPIQQAVEVEMAHTLADVVVRRTGIGAAGYPGDGAVHDHARTMKQLCGWSIERTSSEIAALKRFYDVE